MKQNKIFIPCECSCSGIYIVEDIEFYGAKNEKMRQAFDVALYTYGELNEKPSLWQRIKYAWWHLKTGKKYNDCVIMDRDEAIELNNFLTDKLSNDSIVHQ